MSAAGGSRWSAFLTAAANVVVVACTVLVTGLVVRAELFTPKTAPVKTRDASPRQVGNWKALTSAGHWLGETTAPVVVVEFVDFQCPYCAVVARTTIPAIQRQFGDKVSFLIRHWPLSNHNLAYPAARASECAAAQGRFSAYHELLFAKQDSIGLKSFVDFAKEAGVQDLIAFETCNRQSGRVASIDEDIAEAKRSGGAGTPTIVVNGVMLRSAPDSVNVGALINAALQKSE